MQRYHKKVFFPAGYGVVLNNFTEVLNEKSWKYSAHSIDTIKERPEIKDIISFIYNIKLSPEDIFEFYTDGGRIAKACYRVIYNNSALILVISKDKNLITAYLNASEDNHITLKKELYCNK